MFGSIAADGSEPVLPLALRGGAENGSGGRAGAETVSITAFDGELTLQETTIRHLGYPYAGSAGEILADGSEIQFDYYAGRGPWRGGERPVAMIGAERQPLISMKLL